jgi:hypothetical protein
MSMVIARFPASAGASALNWIYLEEVDELGLNAPPLPLALHTLVGLS